MKKLSIIIIAGLLFISPVFAKGEIQEGLCKVFSGEHNEHIFMVAMYDNAKRDGIAVQFYANGEVEKIAWYQNGILHGTFRSFWSSGYARSILDYQNGILDGRAAVYDRDGNPQFAVTYDKGVLEGHGYYYEGGVLRDTAEYKKGKAISIN